MTTAARPTWAPAKGGNEQGGARIFGPSQKYSSRDVAAHTNLKPRREGQDTADELQKRNLRDELQERERRHFSSKDKSYYDDRDRRRGSHLLLEGSRRDTEDRIMPRSVDADDSDIEIKSDDDSDDDDDDEDEDDTEALLAELEQIKKERAEEKLRKEKQEQEEELKVKEEALLKGNPLLNTPASFNVKRSSDALRGFPHSRSLFLHPFSEQKNIQFLRTQMGGEEQQTVEDKMKNFNIWDLPDVPTKLPPHLELQRTRVVCNKDAPIHTEGITYSGAYASMGIDNSLGLEKFCENFRVDVIRLTEDEMEFDMIGIDAAVANAFRRILISEVPTMAFEKVFIANNTSIVQDEVLSHRLGLVPIAVDPRLFEYFSENDQPNEKNTIVFKLHVRCGKGEPRLTVKSNKMKWLPSGSEFVKESGGSTSKPETYTSFSCSQDSLSDFAANPIAPKYPDINIARLGPGQEIELEAHAVKGIGKTHAKWSPVATAWYRMLPEVILLEEVEDELAEELVKICPVNVFDIEDIGKGKKRATVARPRACTLCRECIREDGWEKRVALRRVRDHFIFTIESTGALPPEVLFTEAVKILEDKCERVITELS